MQPTDPRLKELAQQLAEFFREVSEPHELSKTLNQLLFGAQQIQGLNADELRNVRAFADLLLMSHPFNRATILIEPSKPKQLGE